jgi:putative ABC transport system permease protein
VHLVVWQALKPALAGVVIGVVGAFAAVRVLRTLLFNVAPYDAVTYASVTVLLIAVVISACALPAYRATQIPPGAALRND